MSRHICLDTWHQGTKVSRCLGTRYPDIYVDSKFEPPKQADLFSISYVRSHIYFKVSVIDFMMTYMSLLKRLNYFACSDR